MKLVKHIVKKIAGIILLCLFFLYVCSITCFVHSHVYKGVVIVHSHIFWGESDSPHHTHTDQGFLLVSLLDHFVLDGVPESIHMDVLYVYLYPAFVGDVKDAILPDYGEIYSCRAPPFNI